MFALSSNNGYMRMYPGCRFMDMAIIRSIAMGKARKSAGNVTFRTVRGRTIASEKRAKGVPTRGGAETVFQFAFALTNRFIRMHRYDIDVSFDKTMYGSQGNYFQKVNKVGLFEAFSRLWSAGLSSAGISDEVVDTTVAFYVKENPTSIYRVYKTGLPPVYLTKIWNSKDNPTVPSRDLEIIVNGVSYPATYIAGNTPPDKLQMFDFNSDIRINQIGFGDSAANIITATGLDEKNAAATRSGSLERVNPNQKKSVNWEIEPADSLTKVKYLTVSNGNNVIGSFYLAQAEEGGGGEIIDPTA